MVRRGVPPAHGGGGDEPRRGDERPASAPAPAERLAAAGVGRLRCTEAGVILSVDAGAFRLFSLSARFADPDELVGRPVSAVARCETIHHRLLRAIGDGERVRDLELVFDTIAGERRWALCDIWRDADAGGLDVVFRDITEQRRRDDDRWQVEALARRRIVETVPIGMLVYRLTPDDQLRLVEANPAADRILGVDLSPHVGQPIEEIFPPLARTEIPARYRELARDGGVWRSDQVAYEDERIAGVFDVVAFRPEPSVVVATFLDVTERRRAEEALRVSEERYRAIFDAVSEAIFVHDAETGRIVDHNRMLRALYGFDDDEVPTLAPAQMCANVPPYTPDEVARRLAAAARGEPQRFEWRARRKDGSLFWTEVNLQRARIGPDERLLASVRDIDARKTAEEALRERERQLATLMANLPGMVYRCRNDASWTMEFVSEGCRGLTGYAPSDLVANRRLAYGDLIHPDDRDRVWRGVQAGVSTGGPFHFQYRIRTASGVERWVAEQGVGVLDDEGRLSHLEGVILDVSERVRAEERARDLNLRLEERVRERTAQLEKANEELEAFASAVSHDLRAPLRTLEGFCQALEEDHAPDLAPEARGYLAGIRRANRRMGALIDDLLDLSRATRDPVERREVDLSEVAAAVVSDLRRVEPGREVRISIEPALHAAADPRFVRVILENLLSNAWKFTAHQTDPAIRFAAVTDERARAVAPPDVLAAWDGGGTPVVYLVEDNGAGFDMADADLLFAAFRRLHDAADYPGSGVGLATVQRIVTRHGGCVWARGAVGEGATFYFTLGPP